MSYLEYLKDKKIFSFHVDKKNRIVALSHNINDRNGPISIGDNIEKVFQGLFISKSFKNENFCTSMMQQIDACFISKESKVEHVIVSDKDMNSPFYFDFSFGIEMVVDYTEKVIFKFNDFKIMDTRLSLYSRLYTEFEREFDVFKRLDKIGHFVIDYSIDEPNIFVDDNVKELLQVEEETGTKVQGTLDFTVISKSDVNRDEKFFEGLRMLRRGEIKHFIDEWSIQESWVTLEAKALKRDSNGDCILIGGILYDTSNEHKFNDLEYLYTIYELAITSGGIGIFHYNLDKHSPEYFDCNVIYANILGVKKRENGLYSLDDFMNTLLPLEEEISSNEDTIKALENLMGGKIAGTTDDILKIRNRETGDIKYLLSSSKIDMYFEDGTPRRFGGIIIDVTDRIMKEKKQINFAYHDELTRLANNRKLMKDIRKKNEGIGLFFDLDNFKKINDKHGHLFGDEVLRLFGEILLDVSNQYEGVSPYRLYGDEFFVFAEKKKVKFAKEFESKINLRVEERSSELKYEVDLQASMGYSILSQNVNIDDFIKVADYEMYKVKIRKKDKSYNE